MNNHMKTAMNLVTWRNEKGTRTLLCGYNTEEEYAPSGTGSPHVGV